MGEIVTSNQLTGIYGQVPSTPKKAELNRGFIVYIEMYGPAGQGGFYARTFYQNFPDADPQHHLEFEEEVLRAGNANEFKGRPATRQFPYPEIFDDQIEKVQFGWRPCRVSYIFNSPFGSFVAPDSAQPLIQPVVFRRDKVVIDRNGKVGVQTYEPNNSFFNLEVDRIADPAGKGSASVLRFDNPMLVNAAGDRLGDPPTLQSEREAKCYDYCMDIHIRIDQNKLLDALNLNGAATDAHMFDPASLYKSIVIVFDPPISNGGGSGPPDP